MIEAATIFGITLLVITIIPTAAHFVSDIREAPDAGVAHMILFIFLGFALFIPVMFAVISGMHIAAAHGLITMDTIYEESDDSCEVVDVSGPDCVVSWEPVVLFFSSGLFIYASSFYAGTHMRDWREAVT
jgi:hypothetical protein